MKIRWWLALLAALLTPWVGPHVDRYVPFGWVLLRAFRESPDAAFWVIAGGFLLLLFGIWLLIITWVLRRFQPKRIVDPVFGSMLFMKTPDPGRTYWEAAGTFPPTGDEVEYFVSSPESGPGAEQQGFFRHLTDTWTQVAADVTPILLKGWRESGRPDRTPTFRVSSMSIPREDTPECEWELSFESPDDERKQLFSVTMRGWKPTGEITIDG